jgi:hypothetical protein
MKTIFKILGVIFVILVGYIIYLVYGHSAIVRKNYREMLENPEIIQHVVLQVKKHPEFSGTYNIEPLSFHSDYKKFQTFSSQYIPGNHSAPIIYIELIVTFDEKMLYITLDYFNNEAINFVINDGRRGLGVAKMTYKDIEEVEEFIRVLIAHSISDPA